jgi:hypothetical protein
VEAFQYPRHRAEAVGRAGLHHPIERLHFALVANRAVAPCSKLAMEDWVAKDAVVPGLETVSSDQLYRTMDFLFEADEAIQERVFFGVANLLNLEVDVIFLDTTSTYFEVVAEDDEDPEARSGSGARARTTTPNCPRWSSALP